MTVRPAIEGGTDSQFARLPVRVRPSVEIYLDTDLTNSAPGRVDIDSDGRVYADYFNAFADAQAFTSLDGVTYWPK